MIGEPEVLRLPAGGIVDLPGRGEVFVRDSGPHPGSPPLLLLHGWTATADLNWHACYPHLDRHRVLAFDHRGHGRGLRGNEPFTLEAAADDAAALLETLGTGPVIATGYSMGGPVAQLLWKRHPHLVSGLVLCATAAVFTGRLSERATFAAFPSAIAMARVLPAQLRLRAAMRLMAGSDSWELRQWACDQISSHDWVRILEAGQAIGRFDSRPWIRDVDVPTAVVVTLNDRIVVPERQLALAAAIRGARLNESRGDHSVVLSSPELFVPPLLDAVAGVRARLAPPSAA